MSTQVYYRKGRGPYKNGITHAQRYAEIQEETLKLLQSPKGEKSSKRLAEIMSGVTHRAAPSVAAGFGIGARDIGPTDAHGTPILSSLSVAFASGNHIGRELMPIAPVDEISGEYVVHPQRNKMQLIRGKGRGRAGKSNQVTISETTQPYSTVAHSHTGTIGLDSVLARSLSANRAPMGRLVRLVNRVGEAHADEHEVEVATLMTTAANYSTANKQTLASGSKWDESGAEITKVVQTGKAALAKTDGNSDVIAWMSEPIWNAISRNPGMLGMLSANDRGLMTPELFAQAHGLDGVMISDLQLDSANIASAMSLEYVWGNFFGLCRVSQTPELETATFGYTLQWNAQGASPEGLVNANQGLFTNMWFDPKEGPLGSYWYKVANYYTPELVAVDTGYLVSSVLATFP